MQIQGQSDTAKTIWKENRLRLEPPRLEGMGAVVAERKILYILMLTSETNRSQIRAERKPE
jgi:hypothetical protein